MQRVAALAVCILAAGCMDRGDLDPEDVDVPPGLSVPDTAYQAAYAFAANRVGPARFERLYEVNATSTGPARLGYCEAPECPPLARLPHEHVVFDLVAADWSDAAVAIPVWPDGTVADDGHPYHGLPDCRSRPASCVFLVDAEEARHAARRAGLEERGCELTAFIGWSGDLERFVWQVNDTPCPPPMEYDGRVVLVDTATGRVLGTSGFFSITN